MTTSFRIWPVVLLLVGSILSCTEQQISSLEPQKARLKTTSRLSQNGIASTTDYYYDAANKLTSYTTSSGSKGVIRYDEQNRYRLYDVFPNALNEKVAVETYFVYDTSSNNFSANTGNLINGYYEGTQESLIYILDVNKRVLGFSNYGAGGLYRAEMYTYTADNITSIGFVNGHVSEKFSYEYDDKPNPYYGLITPDKSTILRNDAIQRLSRNNVTKIVDNHNGSVTAAYTYEYTIQGLPSKMMRKGSPEQTIFTYESY